MRKYSLMAITVLAFLGLGIISGCSGEPVNAEANSNEITITSAPAGVGDDVVTDIVSMNGIKSVTVDSHSFEEISACEFGEQFTARDTVSVTYECNDIDGLMPQTVSKEMDFYFDSVSGSWQLINETTTACEVDNLSLCGTSWKCESFSSDELSFIFDGEIPEGDKGVLYIRFLKKIGAFAFDLSDTRNTSTERFFSTVGTGVKIAWAGDAGVIEKSLKLSAGSVEDRGILNLVFGNGENIVVISFGEDAVLIKDQEYDAAVGLEVDENKVYKDDLPVFDVTSDSMKSGEWDTIIGLKEGNQSPELSWPSVDGAKYYAVIMMDVSTNIWLNWYVVIDTNHLEQGAYTDASEYVGPYPPGTHVFVVYVVALLDEPKPASYPLDQVTGDIDLKLNALNSDADGNSGNVLAYGMLKAPYTSPELYYDYR